MEGDNTGLRSSLAPKLNYDQGNGQGNSPNTEFDWRTVELERVRGKYERLQAEWDEQQEHLGRLQGEVYKLRSQLQTQSSFCASLGSVMGNLIWKASRLQPVVELFLSTSKLSDFFCIASGTLVSFMETYGRELPEIKCDEMQFILSVGGIMANVAAIPEGRQYIMTNDYGKELIGHILHILPTIPAGSGDHLKRVLLMVLYNVSLNQIGMLLIQDQKPLHITLSQTIVSDRVPELKLVGLRVLESITSEIPNQSVLNLIAHNVPIQKIEILKDSGEAEISQFAKNILFNLKKAESQVGQLSKPPSLGLNEHCMGNN